MVRRKGERPVEKTWPDWDCGWHPVRRVIESGDGWLEAWAFQACTPIARLAKRGLAPSRYWALSRGAQPTWAEIELLAGIWNVDVSQIVASLPEELRAGLA